MAINPEERCRIEGETTLWLVAQHRAAEALVNLIQIRHVDSQLFSRR